MSDTYKLSVTFEFPDSDMESAVAKAMEVLWQVAGKTTRIPKVSLTRDNDRSNSNFLMPINDKHFKHSKVLIDEVLISYTDRHMAITALTPDSQKDVHTEYCCTTCGCKYGCDIDPTGAPCTVMNGSRRQSFPHSKYI